MFKKQLLTIAILCLGVTQLQSKVIEVSAQNFNAIVEQSKLPVIVDVYATWCGPCQRMAPIFDKVSKTFENKVVFAKINGPDNPSLTGKLGTRAFPSFYLFNQGKLVKAITGSQSEEALTTHLKQTFSL